MVSDIVQFFLLTDQMLPAVIRTYGIWVYLIIFTVIALEEGLIFAIFLPGASLIFIAGVVAGAGQLNLVSVIIVIIGGAILGSTLNYWLGHSVGLPFFQKRLPHLIREEHIEKTHRYFETYGGRTIFFARFIPVVRTFSPFLAGVGNMHFPRFVLYNVMSACFFSISIALAGYLLGMIPEVRGHLQILEILLLISTVITLGFMIYYAAAGMKKSSQQDS
jgi:membrane-associated protein